MGRTGISGQGRAYRVLKWIKGVKVRTRDRKSDRNETRILEMKMG